MNFATPALRWAARGSTAAMILLAVGAGAPAAPASAQAATAPASTVGAAVALASTGPAAAATGPGANPYAPDFGHPYRHGAVPTRGAAARMRTWARQHPAASRQVTASPAVHATSSKNLVYGGGVDGIGVTTGQEKVYLVFYGSQWGTSSTDSNGNLDFTGDPSGEAPYLQQMFKGLGTDGELWSGVMTQYCQGVSVGAQTCPAMAAHVAYPHSVVLAGVWYDSSAAAPTEATAFQLGTEAIKAAAHFGNTTAAANRDAQYVILSPHNTHPDGFNTASGAFCAWHDYNGDPYVGVSSPFDVAFTNMPYVTDAGLSCGKDFVNSRTAGNLDGASMVLAHEYSETITDQNPNGGWLDSAGEENADKCAWLSSGSGAAADLRLATGTFAMQGTWANDANSGKGGCLFQHAIVSTQLMRNHGFENSTIAPWRATSGVLKKKSRTYPAHSGSWLARLGGRTAPHTDTLAQKVTLAPGSGSYGAATFSFWLRVRTNDPAKKASDRLTVEVLNAAGTSVEKVLHTYSNLNATSHYVHHSFSLKSFLGQQITLKFIGTQTLSGHRTSFLVDDTALNAS